MLEYIRVSHWVSRTNRPRVSIAGREVVAFMVVDNLVSVYLTGGGQLILHMDDWLAVIPYGQGLH